jgi:hypothetical protein
MSSRILTSIPLPVLKPQEQGAARIPRAGKKRSPRLAYFTSRILQYTLDAARPERANRCLDATQVAAQEADDEKEYE